MLESAATLYSTKATNHILPTHPLVLVLGNEREGVSPALAVKADAALRIPSTGVVESLSVVQAAAAVSHVNFMFSK